MDDNQNEQQATANTETSTPATATNATPIGTQPDGTTLDTRPAAAESIDKAPASRFAPDSTLHYGGEPTHQVGAVMSADKDGQIVHAVVLEHALVSRLADLAQRVRDFVGDEARPLVNELMTVAADVRQYL